MKPVSYIHGMKPPGWELTGGNWEKPLELEEWRPVLHTNLTAPFLFAQAIGPHFLSPKSWDQFNYSMPSFKMGSLRYLRECSQPWQRKHPHDCTIDG